MACCTELPRQRLVSIFCHEVEGRCDGFCRVTAGDQIRTDVYRGRLGANVNGCHRLDNRHRIHPALGYRTPHEVHNEYVNSQLAA